MASWRIARAIEVLREQLNEAAPNRSKASDGGIGDAAHAASKSDHNPNSKGVVRARDYTHDPADGLDSYKLAEHLRLKQDVRIKYVISNRKIFSGPAGPSPWVWRSYNGKNPHDAHVHVSVGRDVTDGSDAKYYDDGTPWSIGFTVGLPDPTAPKITLAGAQGREPGLLRHHVADVLGHDRQGG